MSRFKHESDRKQFECPPAFVDPVGWNLLTIVVKIIDLISVMLGFGEIWITCYIDDRPYKSQHPKGLAVDIRCHRTGDGAKPSKWYWAMGLLSKALHMLDKRIVFVMHEKQYGEPNEHIHVHVVIGE